MVHNEIHRHGQGLIQWLLKPAQSPTLIHYRLIQHHQQILAIYIKLCQNISTAVAPRRKTIIILDLQLYAKSLQLEGRNEIANNFVFRPGELHIVCNFQHAIGKYIENSGLDQSFIDCDIYGPVTVNQILKGKLMKKGMEAYMVLYLALNKICLKDFSKTFSLKSFCECFNILDTTETYDAEIEAVTTQLFEKKFFQTYLDFKIEVTGQAKFYLNFVKMYELLLLFMRATRQSLWELHLASLEAMIPYFFVHDLQNYARLKSEYIAQMRNIKIYEEETWKFFKNGNFSVNKSHFTFSAIDANHGIEQLNRKLKVVGGVKGLLQNENALHCFILCAPVLDSVCKDFRKRNSLKKE